VSQSRVSVAETGGHLGTKSKGNVRVGAATDQRLGKSQNTLCVVVTVIGACNSVRVS
jgi:hypothetical protein